VFGCAPDDDVVAFVGDGSDRDTCEGHEATVAKRYDTDVCADVGGSVGVSQSVHWFGESQAVR
jgi:hypothetical protein